MHLADTFIQSNIQCIQAIPLYQYSLGIKPLTSVLLAPCSSRGATWGFYISEVQKELVNDSLPDVLCPEVSISRSILEFYKSFSFSLNDMYFCILFSYNYLRNWPLLQNTQFLPHYSNILMKCELQSLS